MEKFKENRDYDTGEKNDVTFFTGYEVEKTPAYGMKTLFVVGIKPLDTIERHYEKEQCEHIFFGANHSFNPKDDHMWRKWEIYIMHFVNQDILCSIDIPYDKAETFLQSAIVERNNVIPQIRIPMPYVQQWPYNTMLKIDDVDFKATNPGVWCHSLHELKDKNKFTDWSQYKLDKVLK